MKNLVDLVQGIIDRISLEISVSEVVGSKLTVCNTLFLTENKTVTIDGLEYTVADFSLNNWLEVTPKGHSMPVPTNTTTLTAPSITFLQGTPISANNEYQQLSLKTSDKTPFIWLVEPYSYDEQPFDSSIDVEFKGKLLFLDWADKDMLNSKHNDLAIKPMNNLKEAFINVINEDFNFKRLETTKSLTRPRFGVYQSDKGAKKQIIEDELSGVEFDLDLKVYDASVCCATSEDLPINTYATVKNTDDSYNVTFPNGGTQIVPDSEVSNSDDSYIVSLPATNSLEIPDITHTDSDLTHVILPGQVAMICSPFIDAIVENTDASYSTTVANGGTLVVPNTTQVIKDSAGTVLHNNSIPSTTSEDQIIVDSVVSNSDVSYSVNVKAEDNLILPDIINVDSDGSNVPTPAQTPFVSTLCPVKVGIAYTPVQLTDQTISYRVGDNGYHNGIGTYNYTNPVYPVNYAQLSNFLTLVSENSFGNFSRYTDINGLQVYADNYVIDHYRNLGIYRIRLGSGTWNTHIDTAEASTQNGFTDWRLANNSEVSSMLNYGQLSIFTGSPLITIGGVIIRTSTTRRASTTNAWYFSGSSGVLNPIGKTTNQNAVMVRTHF